METFEDRLRLQKVIYMIEAFGVYLGYDFSWYLRGPYCTVLSRTGFEVEQIAARIPKNPEIGFVDSPTQKNFDRAVKFIENIMDGPEDLDRIEIVASLHLLATTTDLSRQKIFDRVIEKMSVSSERRAELLPLCESMWAALLQEKLLSADRANAAPAPSDGAANGALDIDPKDRDLDSTKKTLADYQQYGDIMLMATANDCKQARSSLELNERPAYTQNPGRVANLLSDKEMSKLYNDVVKAYG